MTDDNSANKSSKSKATTIYSNVIFREKNGKLRLTSEKITFKPDDWEDGRYDSWRWTAILKHQISPNKALLKLVSKQDPNQAVLFTLPSAATLDQVRNDITYRMRASRRKQQQQQQQQEQQQKEEEPQKEEQGQKQQRRTSNDTISSGRFYSRRGSDSTFATVKDELGDSSMSNLSSSSFHNMEVGGGASRRVSFLGMDESFSENQMDNSSSSLKAASTKEDSKPRKAVLLDPLTDSPTKSTTEENDFNWKQWRKTQDKKKETQENLNTKVTEKDDVTDEVSQLKQKKEMCREKKLKKLIDISSNHNDTAPAMETTAGEQAMASVKSVSSKAGTYMAQVLAIGFLAFFVYDAMINKGGQSSTTNNQIPAGVDHSAPAVKIEF